MNNKNNGRTTLPRNVPIEPDMPAEFQQDYIYVKTAVEITDTSKATINRHLRMGWLAGLKMGPRLWLVRRISERDENGDVVGPPAIDIWEPGQLGVPYQSDNS